MSKERRIIEQLKSWETGYISPSAQMLMKEARELIEEQIEIIHELEKQLQKKSKKA